MSDTITNVIHIGHDCGRILQYKSPLTIQETQNKYKKVTYLNNNHGMVDN
jgi:hypothetical protein